MDPKLAAAVKTAMSLWVTGALEHLKGHDEQMAELRRAMIGDATDVRVVYHVRSNAISLETVDRATNMFADLFLEQLVPDDGGFALPETETKQ
jgi:hypothetical protein